MCVRLYPEIPVAMEVLSKINNNEDVHNIYLKIDECIKLQKKINYSPFLNVFTSAVNSSKNWDENDYKKYLIRVGYFIPQSDPNEYKLNASALFDENFSFDDKNAVRRCLRENLLIEGSYSGRTIVALGL